MLTKDQVVALLKTNDKAVGRALLVINRNQTASEQASEQTINRNGEGFRPCHARMGTSMANFFQRRGYLSPKQIAYWRKPMADGNMRLAIYWRQLAVAAEAKQAAKVTPVPTLTPKQAVAQAVTDGLLGADVGNMLEELMVLQEQFNDYLDSDDEPTLEKMKARIDELNAAIAASYKGA